MLTDSSLTNILVVSGVSQIRYRVYNQHCDREKLVNYLKCTPNYDASKDILMRAYKNLISSSIPATWRITSDEQQSSPEKVTLELWVFWFDERHTGKIDANDDLDALEEIKVGSFTWENAYSKIQSPTASPIAFTTAQSNSSTPVTVSEEYRLFIKSVRNLVHVQMKYKGAFPIGEFYIFPNTDQGVIGSDESTSQQQPMNLTTSLLCCSYNIYLASTNLIFQPNTRRMGIRPITMLTIRIRGKKVILSPSGESAYIANNNYNLPQQAEENILKKWSLLLDIPYANLIQPSLSQQQSSSKNNSQQASQQQKDQEQQQQQQQQQQQRALPNLVAIKSAIDGETFYYPTALVFISSSSRLSPTAMAGMNGLFGFNQGFTEDLGDKWHRWTWSEKISNFWEYACPQDTTITTVLNTLSQDNNNNNGSLLQKAISEPVIASPLMAKKSVATPGSNSAYQRNSHHELNNSSNASSSMATPSSMNNDEMAVDDQQPQQQIRYQHKSKAAAARYQSGLSLVDFAMAHFAMPSTNEDLPEYPELLHNSSNNVNNAATPVIQYPNMVNNQQQLQQPQQQNSTTNYKLNNNTLLTPNNTANKNMLNTQGGGNTNTTNTATNSAYQSPQIPNLELDAFGMVESMDVDSMVMDMPNRWNDDGMDGLDNFDFGVTEEDFDFFESSGPSTAPAPIPAAAPAAAQTSLLQQQPTTIKSDLNDFSADNDTVMLDLIKQEPSFDAAASSSFDNNKELMSLDQKQQQHILDTEMENAVNLSHEVSAVTPLEIGMASAAVHDSFTSSNNNTKSDFQQQQENMLVLQHDQLAQGHMFVPPQFAPVKIEYQVNDAKYINGGKFTYAPNNTKRRKGGDYQPDYVPIVRERKSNGRRKSSKLLMDTIQNENRALETSNSAVIVEEEEALFHDPATVATENTTMQSSSVAAASSHDDLGSNSTSSSEEEEDDSDDSSEGDSSEDEATRVSRTYKSLSRAQDRYIDKLTSLAPTTRTTAITKSSSVDKMVMDYDSPFARTIASSIIRMDTNTEIPRNENEELRALDYLCQQVVMGGYPFAGGIESMSSNGFEANEGESAKVLVARRRNLLQKFNGDTIHIPSTPNDVDVMTQNFKNVLNDIFYQQKKSSDMNDMIIDSLPLPASVTVKGPLNVQQYYDLSETNQTHSKYGKYQVKKRRPAEPNLDTLQPPHIMVSRQEDFIEGTSKLIMFWEKLRLEPYSNKKHINYFVMYPKNESIENNVSQFFKGLSTIYETCQLGVHHPGNVGPYRKGLVPVPLLPAQYENESFEDRQLRSYVAECQNLGSAIGASMAENVHIVIYMINPASHLGSNLDLGRCFSKLVGAYHHTAASIGLFTRTSEKTRARLVLQLMPIEHILRSTSFGGCLKFGLKEIAFSVYSKCHTVVDRHLKNNTNNIISSKAAAAEKKPVLVTELYAPPFILTKPIPDTIQFQIKKAISHFPTILESLAVLHMGYCFSFDKRWMIIVWTDNRGELMEFTVLDNARHNLPLTNVFEEAWARTKEIAKRTGFAWTLVIAKIGLLFEEELQAWIQCISSNQEKVAIVSLDLESSLYVNPTCSDIHHGNMNDLSNDSSLNSSATNTPNMTPTSATASNSHHHQQHHGKKMFSDVDTSEGPGQTKAMLLNHRVAYSNKRERASYGILSMDPISEVEEWMIPLASGYMIHTPPITENPNNELFNCNPLVIEIHLLYNQTNHSAYSTLRDIIKKYHALSYVNVMPSNSSCFPIHLALVERLSRILLVVNT